MVSALSNILGYFAPKRTSPIKSGRITPKSVRQRKIRNYSVFVLVFGLVILSFTEYSPIHSVVKFFRALTEVILDFDFTISRNPNDCFIVLWTQEHRGKAVRLKDPKNLTELYNAGFNQ